MNQGEFELSADPSRYVTLPVQNEAIWRKYQITLDTFWTVYEINIERDKHSLLETFKDKSQRQYLLKVIAFMLIAHNTIVTKELFLDLINHVDIKEASYYFGSQADSKKTHSMMYSLLLDELIETTTYTEQDGLSEDTMAEKKTQLINEVIRLPEVRGLLRWYVENVNLEQDSFTRKMFAFATLQGVIFAVPFMLFSWLEKQYPSKINGLMKSNQLISRDEKLNLSFSCMLFDYIEEEIYPDVAADIIKQAVFHAKSVFIKALPVSTLGLDCDSMSQFIEHSADLILIDTNHERIYKVEKTPFDWVVEPKVELSKQMEVPVLNITANDSTTAQASFDLDDDF